MENSEYVLGAVGLLEKEVHTLDLLKVGDAPINEAEPVPRPTTATQNTRYDVSTVYVVCLT